ncbi:hypothetical protein [Arthrobacter rhombi]|uniref:hypothetical protein n=1 Tax=Arthrobacter rhombi TaxID=71253 RepID=UPI0031D11126
MTTNSTTDPAGVLDAEHLNELAERVAGAAPEFTSMADAIWDDPEMRWEEFRAQDKHQAAARAHGFTVTEKVGVFRRHSVSTPPRRWLLRPRRSSRTGSCWWRRTRSTRIPSP